MNSLGPLGDFATLEIEHVLPLTLDKELWQIAPSLRTPKSKWIGGPSNDKTTGDLIKSLLPNYLRNSNPEHRTLIDLRANLNRALKRSRYDIMNYR